MIVAVEVQHHEWTVQVNDLIGGWIVTNYPHPASQHRFDDPARRGVIACECTERNYALLIARLLNGMTCFRHEDATKPGRRTRLQLLGLR